MSSPFLQKILNVVLRLTAFAIGAGHIVGYLGFARYYSPWIIVPGIVLLALSVTPLSWVRRDPVLFIVIGCVTAWSYVMAGLPFLDERHDAIARSIFLAEFIALLVVFVAAIVIWFRKYLGFQNQTENKPGPAPK